MKHSCQKRLLAHVDSLDCTKYRQFSLYLGVLLVSDSMNSKAPCRWRFGEDDNVFSTREAGSGWRNTEIKNTEMLNIYIQTINKAHVGSSIFQFSLS